MDFALSDLSISFYREKSFGFHDAIIEHGWNGNLFLIKQLQLFVEESVWLGIIILYKKPQKQPPNLFSFLSPLSVKVEVWMDMGTACVLAGASSASFILSCLTPFAEWNSPHPCKHSSSRSSSRRMLRSILSSESISTPFRIQQHQLSHSTGLRRNYKVLRFCFKVPAKRISISFVVSLQGDVDPRPEVGRKVGAVLYFRSWSPRWHTARYTWPFIYLFFYPDSRSHGFAHQIVLKDLATKPTKIKYGSVGSGSTFSFFRVRIEFF